MAETPKDDDAFEDTDFEDLDPIEDEDDLGDDSWDDDNAAENDGNATADADGAAPAKKKSFIQKNFMMIVVGAVVVFGGVGVLTMLGGGSAPAPTPEETAADATAPDETGVVELAEQPDMPPMPSPINPEETITDPAATDPNALTPMPSPQETQGAELVELTIEEIPAQPAGSTTPQGEAPFDFAPEEIPPTAPDIVADIPAEPTHEIAPAPQEIAAEPVPAPDLTPQLEAQQAEIESLQTKLAESESQAQKSLEDSLAAKEQEIAALNKTVADLEKQLAGAKAAASESKQAAAEKPTQEEPVKTAAPMAEPAPATVKPKPVQAATARITSWELKGAQPGKAVLSSKSTGDTRNIAVGDTVDGLGRITAIAKENGRWTVRGTSGQITR